MATTERCPVCTRRGFEDDFEGCYENEIPCEIAGRRSCEDCRRDVCVHCFHWGSVCTDCAAKYEAAEAEAKRKVTLWDGLVAFAAAHETVAVANAVRHVEREASEETRK